MYKLLLPATTLPCSFRSKLLAEPMLRRSPSAAPIASSAAPASDASSVLRISAHSLLARCFSPPPHRPAQGVRRVFEAGKCRIKDLCTMWPSEKIRFEHQLTTDARRSCQGSHTQPPAFTLLPQRRLTTFFNPTTYPSTVSTIAKHTY